MNKKGRPSKIQSKYKTLMKSFTLEHPCYKIIKEVNCFYELEVFFINELLHRKKILLELRDKVKLNIFHKYFKKYDEVELLNFANMYLDNLEAYNEVIDIPNVEITQKFSLKEVIGGEMPSINALNKLSSIHYMNDKILIKEGYESTFDLETYDYIFNNSNNEIEMYLKIGNYIMYYLAYSEAEYKKFSINEYGKFNENGYSRYRHEYLENYVFETILSDYKLTLKYLEKALVDDKIEHNEILSYLDEQKIYTKPSINIVHNLFRFDQSSQYYPNKISNIKLNFNLSKNALWEQMEIIQSYLNDKKYNYFDEIYNFDLFSNNLLTYKNNTNISMIEETTIEKAKLNTLINLYIYDCFLLQIDNETIEKNLSDYLPFEKKDKWIPNKEKHFEEIKNFIKSTKKLKLIITGINDNDAEEKIKRMKFIKEKKYIEQRKLISKSEIKELIQSAKRLGRRRKRIKVKNNSKVLPINFAI